MISFNINRTIKFWECLYSERSSDHLFWLVLTHWPGPCLYTELSPCSPPQSALSTLTLQYLWSIYPQKHSLPCLLLGGNEAAIGLTWVSLRLYCSMKSLIRVWLFVTPWTVAYQVPHPMGFFFQARILQWVAISFSRRSSQPRVWTWVSCIVGKCFTVWATREVKYCSIPLLKAK